jgi:hypothetical protein
VRNIPIPIDASRLAFVCVTEPRPRLVSQESGEVKVDRNGQTVYQVGLSAADATGRVELVNVSVSGESQMRTAGSPPLRKGQRCRVLRTIALQTRRLPPAPLPQSARAR